MDLYGGHSMGSHGSDAGIRTRADRDCPVIQVWRIKMFTTISTRNGLLRAALLAAAFSNGPLKAQHVVTSQVMLPLNTTVPVNTSTLHDQVTLSGNLHLMTQFAPGDPIVPPSPVRI